MKNDKCDYCNIENNESKLIVLGNWNNLYIERDEYENFYISAKSDGIAEMRINYCPFCGKKLGGE